MADETDRRFLAAAIRLGAGALGTTWPNPAVGAVVVKEGRVVGRGRTVAGGRPHGEPQALAEAGAAARGATLYVSLEPCSHHGRTPPCVDAIIRAGIARVVAPGADPDPRVAGQGFERLRIAEIDVVTGLMAAEAARAQAGHISRVTRRRPHAILKLAVSADGAIGRVGERQVAVTADIARNHVQALRSRVDAILVGRGTVEADDPDLTCRLPGLEHRSPVRVVLVNDGRLSGSHKVFRGAAPTWIFKAAGEHVKAPSLLVVEGWGGGTSEPNGEQRVTPRLAPPHKGEGDRLGVLGVPRGEGPGLDLNACMARLADEGITRLLVEGGAKVARAFLEADLIDEALIFRSPLRLGGEIVPALAGLPITVFDDPAHFRRVERRMFGADQLTRYERAR